MQYAFTRAIADHFFTHYDGVLKSRRRGRQQEGLRSALLPGGRRDRRWPSGSSARRSSCDPPERRWCNRVMPASAGRRRSTSRSPRLGDCRVPSPMSGVRFVDDDERVLYPSTLKELQQSLAAGAEPPAMESAGPRERLFFDPAHAGLRHRHLRRAVPRAERRDSRDRTQPAPSLRRIADLRIPLRLSKATGGRARSSSRSTLTPECVNRIHEMRRLAPRIVARPAGPGGDGRSTAAPRHPASCSRLAATARLRGAHAISAEAARRGIQISVIGVPKTIDNDVSFVQKTFGFETAVSEARRATYAANTEAESAQQRHRAGEADGPRLGIHRRLRRARRRPGELLSGSRGAVHARTAAHRALRRRLERRGHAVIVVAEGAGQDLMAPPARATRRETSSTATSACSCARPSHAASANRERRSPQIHRSELRHQERAGDGRTTRPFACCSDTTRSTPA